MAYPEKGAKYAGEDRAAKMCNRADGGAATVANDHLNEMADSRMPPTDEAIGEADVKTWGSPENARAAANARKWAKERGPLGEDEEKALMNQTGRMQPE